MFYIIEATHTETQIFNFQPGSSVCFGLGCQKFMFVGRCPQVCIMDCILTAFNTDRGSVILCLLINGNVTFLFEAFKNCIKFDLQRADLVCKYNVLNSL
jgi:hypothetical protein